MLSIVIPTLNESKTGYLSDIIAAYEGIEDCELICVDGGSEDNTLAMLQGTYAKVIETNILSRAGRLNAGIRQASCKMILLHHPRSVIDPEGIRQLIRCSHGLKWGAFTHQFNIQHPVLAFTSWYSNCIRGDGRGIYYLDHCLFAQRQLLLDIGLLPEIDIFEDTELCLRLKSKVKGERLPYISRTSAIRFQTRGIYKQAIKNQLMKWQYYFKRSDKKINRDYEQGLGLNTEYKGERDEDQR